MLYTLLLIIFIKNYWNVCLGQNVDNFNIQKRVEYDAQGRLKYFPKAINGAVVRKGEFQNFVSIQTRTGNHLCGAMMLDVDFVITTASCVTKISNKQPYAAAELQVMNDALENETVKSVNQIFRHSDFNPVTLDNDVAVLNIQSFKWSNDVEMLTAIDKPSINTECKVIGWGKSDESEPFLQKVTASIIDDGACSTKYSFDHSNKFCVQGKNGSCLEEPGSGLICDDELTGILSFGNGCNQNGDTQMIYTDLTKHNVWIDEVFRTTITKKSDDVLPNQTERTTPITNTVTQRTTSQTFKPQSYTTTTERMNPSEVSSVQEENEGHWVYQVVMDTCQLSFVTCEPVWSNHHFNVQCKRGYFPYGCFHIVKGFVKDTSEENARSIGGADEDTESNRLLKFKSYLKHKPLNKVQKAVENILDTEQKSRSNFKQPSHIKTKNYQEPVIMSPYDQWFQRIFCLPVLQFKHFNNFPQHMQWRSDCDRFQGFDQSFAQPENRAQFATKSSNTVDPKIYFPDSNILTKNKN